MGAIRQSKFKAITDSDKAEIIAKLYLTKCTDLPLYVGIGYNVRYLKIHNHFKNKTNPDEYQKLYEYLDDLTEKQNISITQLFEQSEEHRLKKISNDNKRRIKGMGVVEKYEYGIGDLYR